MALKRRGSRRFPLFDLMAAVWAIDPSPFAAEETRVRLHRNLRVEFGSGERRVTVVRGFTPEVLWERFLGLVNAPRGMR